MSFINKKTLSIIISVLSIIGYGYFAFAVAPTGGYSPAQTLDPACAPGDTDCFVQESWKIDTGNNFVYNTTSNIGIGTNTPRRQLDVSGDFEQVNGNASIRSYADPLADMSMFAGYFEGVANAYTFSPGNTSLSMVGDWDGEQVSFFGNVLNDNYFNGIMANGTDVDIMSQDPLSGSATAIGLRNSSINSSIQLTSPFGNVRVNSPEGLVLEPKTTAERAASAGDGTIRFNSDLACLELYNSGWGCLGGGSGWALTGNAGTDGGVMNFIGTTDAEDFVVKTNGNKIATFGQFGNIAMGTDVVASGDYAIAMGLESVASGYASTALGFATTASGVESTAFGNSSNASGDYSTAAGTSATASGDFSTAIGNVVYARSFGEIALGHSNIDYTPVSTVLFEPADRLFSIGNLNHNAYTLWKDGSFAYNDDNFQNDDFGVEQNMFYFNFGSHDGLGAAQTKRAIRLGSASNDEWDINSSNVGTASIAISFVNNNDGFPTAIASGENSIAIGDHTVASGYDSRVFGNDGATASGIFSLALGDGGVASGVSSVAISGGRAFGTLSFAQGSETGAHSYSEVSFGTGNTDYIPTSMSDKNLSFGSNDRLFNIGNGISNSLKSDAFTILKNGQTGIAIDNFEANTNGSIFQVGDGGTGVIGYVNTGTGAWVAVSDARKKNSIQDLSYGLDTVLALSPKSYVMNESGEHSIGFLAQDVLSIVPEAVFGSESKGYGMSYATLVPVTVKAIQQLNLKLADIQKVADATDTTFVTNMRNWLASVANGITDLFAKKVHVEQLCVGVSGDETCLTKAQVDQLLQSSGTPTVVTPPMVIPSTDPLTPPVDPITPPTDPVTLPDPTPVIPDPVPTPVPDVVPVPVPDAAPVTE